jgi:hypothetical protein
MRIAAPTLALTLGLLAAELLAGASYPLLTLILSAGYLAVSIAMVIASGASFVTPRLTLAALGAVAIAAALVAIHGESALPAASAWLAAGAIWLTGVLAARRAAEADFALDALIWTSFLFCFVRLVDASNAGQGVRDALIGALPAPSDTPILFSLFAILAFGRLLQIHGRIPRAGLTPSAWFEEVFHRGAGALLLAGAAITGIVLSGSLQMSLTTIAGLVLMAGLKPDRTGAVRRPRAAIALAILFVLAGATASVVSVNVEGRATVARLESAPLERWSIYLRAVPDAPLLGQGPQSISAIADRSMNLSNETILSAPGGARNAAIHILIEWGGIGLALAIMAIVFVHTPLSRSNTPPLFARSTSRMALGAALVMTASGLTLSSLDTPAIGWLYAFLMGIAVGSNASLRTRIRQPDEWGPRGRLSSETSTAPLGERVRRLDGGET